MYTQKILTYLQEKNGVAPAFALGVCFIIAFWLIGHSFYAVHTLDQTLSVTGSATEEVRADSVKWTIGVQRYAYADGLGSVQYQVQRDAQAVRDWLTKKGIQSEEITINPVFSNEEYNQNNGAPRRWAVHVDVVVAAKDVERIAELSHEVTGLVSQGIFVSPQMPEYFVTSLPEMRVNLMGKAIKDARVRAEKIAESSGRGVGKLQSAASGVVQVMAKNSVDVSDYGSYDTSTIDKKIMVTVRAAFFLK
jgi:uncharacterized protein